MCDRLPVLARHPGTAVVAAEFSAYLVDRFGVMSYIVPGAYEDHPTSKERRPVMIKLEGPSKEAIDEFEQNWKRSERSSDDSEAT